MALQRSRIGLYRRVSTRHQIDNERYVRAFRDMSEVIERYAGEPIEYDEGGQARSGGTIRGRKVFEAMLADVAHGDLDGIAAPDVRSLSRGEWLIDGKTIADTLMAAGAQLITRDGLYNLRNRRDLKSFQDQLYWAMQEREQIRRRFYEGQAARARNTVEGQDEPWGRFRTMIGFHLDVLLDEQGRPRITSRGQVKRGLAKDPAQIDVMRTLIRELDAQHTRGGLFQALFDAGVEGPEPSAGRGGWTKRSLLALLQSPLHQGHWSLVRNPRSTVWYGLDPRSDEFDVSKMAAIYPELRYWTKAQADGWAKKFSQQDDKSRRVSAEREAHPHPLLGLLRCPRCHRLLLGKGVSGYICPRGARGTKAPDPCLPVFTVRESSAQAAMRELLPLLAPRLEELSDAARAALRRRESGGVEIRLAGLDNEERAMLASLRTLTERGLEVPESFTERLIEIAQERKRALAEQDAVEQVAQARIEAERVLAGINPGHAVEVLATLDAATLAEVYRAFFAWVEVRPLGPGRVGGVLVDWMMHDPQSAGSLQVVERLADLLLGVA